MEAATLTAQQEQEQGGSTQSPVRSPRRFSLVSFLRSSSSSTPNNSAASPCAPSRRSSSPMLLSPPTSPPTTPHPPAAVAAAYDREDTYDRVECDGDDDDTDQGSAIAADRRSSDPGVEFARRAAGLRRDSVADLMAASAPVIVRRSSMPATAHIEVTSSAAAAAAATTATTAKASKSGSSIFQRRKSREKTSSSSEKKKTTTKKSSTVPEITIERADSPIVTLLTSSSPSTTLRPSTRERRGSMAPPPSSSPSSSSALSSSTRGAKTERDGQRSGVPAETRMKRSRSLSAIPEVAEEMQRRSSSREHEAVDEVSSSSSSSSSSSAAAIAAVDEMFLLPVRDDMSERARKRCLVINEIVNTERDYVRDLHILLSVFLLPMQSAGIVSAEEARRLFSNLKTLMAINQALLADLEARVRVSQGDSIGECFLLFGDYMRLYTPYCANQNTAYKTLARCTKASAQFREFLKQAHANEEVRLINLDGYLIKPMQRLCKYPLLLRELINVTDVGHKDYERLTRALNKIHQVVVSVNNSQKLGEEMDAMANVIERLQGTERFDVPLVVPGRKYFQEGILSAVAQDAKSVSTPLHYFLFSDLLILTTAPSSSKVASTRNKSGASKKVDVHEMLPLLDAQVRLDDAECKVAIELGGKEYVVPFGTAELRSSWTQAHRAALEDRTASPLVDS